MPIYIKDGRCVLFVHVPKAAGTSVERHFARSGWDQHLRDRNTGVGTMHWLRRTSPQHLHADLLSQMFRLDRFDAVFMAVRDPMTRFRSEVAMRHWKTGLPSTSTIERWTETHLGRCARDPHVFDNHLRPQVDFQLPEAVVYRVEDGLDALVADLNARFDLGLLDTVRPKMTTRSKVDFDSSDLELSRTTERRVRKFYAKDYRRFRF